MGSGGRLLLVEMVIPPGGEPHPGKMLDVMMLSLTGGMERTEAEYSELLQRAGLRLTRVIPTQTPVSIIEAVPASRLAGLDAVQVVVASIGSSVARRAGCLGRFIP